MRSGFRRNAFVCGVRSRRLAPCSSELCLAVSRAVLGVLIGISVCAPALGSNNPREAQAESLALLAPPEEPAESANDTRELIYKTINFFILVGALGYFLRKPAAEYFASRSAAIRKGIEEGRKALEASEAELGLIEEKLAKLGEDIRAFEEEAERDALAEAERFKRETETEARKLLEFARARLDSATRAARQELQSFAAAEALRLAEQSVRSRLDAPRRERLFARYLAGLAGTGLASRN